MQPQVKHAVLDCLRRGRPGRLLDFPAGTGWLRDNLDDPAWEYHGADLFTRPGTPNFRAADLQQRFPFEDGEFDYVACLEGLEHIENYHHVLRESRRVLRPGGMLLISTPNPLNIKSRLRYFWRGTFHGFPHLIDMPAEGEHLHASPINLSFLIAFADKYELELQQVHQLRIKPAMYRYAPHALAIQTYTWLRSLTQRREAQAWMRRLASWNVLLNDGMVVSFTRRAATAQRTVADRRPQAA
jgi:2-polyprenyl-3-methyl-5-hydroxy-6-metoxy-1,4-benzoquinol methylase